MNLELDFSPDAMYISSKIEDGIGFLCREELKRCGYKTDFLKDPTDVIHALFTMEQRMIEKRPRKVHLSKNFVLPKIHKEGFDQLRKKIEKGEDIHRYLSKTITKLDFSDMMLFDWNIHHFHLGGDLDRDGFVTRTGHILYAMLTKDDAYFIAIKPHDNWCDIDLIETIHHNWPEIIAPYNIGFIVENEEEEEGKEEEFVSIVDRFKKDLKREFKDDENHKISDEKVADIMDRTTFFSPPSAIISDSRVYSRLRKIGINAPVKMKDGTVYMGPGQGYTGGHYSAEASLNTNALIRQIRHKSKLIKKDLEEAAKRGFELRFYLESVYQGDRIEIDLVRKVCAPKSIYKLN